MRKTLAFLFVSLAMCGLAAADTITAESVSGTVNQCRKVEDTDFVDGRTFNACAQALLNNTKFLNDGGVIGNPVNLVLEGTTADAYETTLDVVDPTADRTVTIPDATGTVVLNKSNATTISGTCTLDGASPSVCTATVTAGTFCVCSPVGTSAAIAGNGCAVSLSSTTLTVTGPNAGNYAVNYHCF